jgi:hypothetical protein
MGEVQPLPVRQLVLVDERDAGLRVTWHAERELIVLSVWHGPRCSGSFRLPIADAPRLAAFLSAVSAEWAAQVVAERQAAPAAGLTADEGGHA